jgi:hypothetical protein
MGGHVSVIDGLGEKIESHEGGYVFCCGQR